jgi:predicted DNA-binding antitoxin AbrB/MazE fold protein
VATTIQAKYENGVFRPLKPVQVQEGTVVEVHIPTGQKSSAERSSIRNLPFFGVWRDRDDIGDSVEYVDRLRDNSRG